ncbi:MAG: hypothetical protein AAFS10_27475, partial [Myxococcota bacterium]
RTVAHVLQLSLGDDPITEIQAALAQRGRCLLVLDNAEQVAKPIQTTVGAWLQGCPEASWVLTSRIRLGLEGEQMLTLGPLAVPDRKIPHRAQLLKVESVALFMERARLLRPSFHVDDAHVETLAELIRALEGMPLAIELAAAKVRVLGLEQISQRLAKRFTLLKDPRRSGRQRALRATLEGSWELLSNAERRALVQCAAFRGDFSLEDAEAVLDSGDETLDRIEALVDQSLLRSMEGPAGHVRYGLYMAIREYAQEQATDQVTLLKATQLRHARHYASYGTPDHVRRIQGAEAPALMAALMVARDNVAAAIRYAQDADAADTAAYAMVAMLGIAFFKGPGWPTLQQAAAILAMEGRSEEAEIHLRLWMGLLANRAMFPEHALEVLGEQLMERPDLPLFVRGRLLFTVGHAYAMTDRIDRAEPLLLQALELTSASGDALFEASTCGNLVYMAMMHGDIHTAQIYLERGKRVAHAHGDLLMMQQFQFRTLHHQIVQGHVKEARAILAKMAGALGTPPDTVLHS